MGGLSLRIFEWVEQLPPWLRPVLYGPCLLLFAIYSRGGVLALPLAAIYLIFYSKQPMADLLLGIGVLTLLFAAAALGGLMHGLIGHRIARVRFVGPFLAGMVDLSPYMVAIGLLLQLRSTGQLFTPWDDAVYFAVGVCTVIFGPMVGWALFYEPTTSSERNR